MTTPTESLDFKSRRSRNTAFNKPIRAFLAHLHKLGKHSKTIDLYEQCLHKMVIFVESKGVGQYAEVTLSHLQALRFALLEYGYSDSFIERVQRNASLFFRFLKAQGLIERDPARKLKIYKAPQYMGNLLTVREVRLLLDQPDMTAKTGIRDRAMLETLYATGMYIFELLRLNVEDVDLEHGLAHVQGKKYQRRTIPLGSNATNAIAHYLDAARPLFYARRGPSPVGLWLSSKGRLKTPELKHLLSAYGQAAQLSMPVDARSLRLTCAVHLLRRGADPQFLMHLQDHQSLKALRFFVQTSTADLLRKES